MGDTDGCVSGVGCSNTVNKLLCPAGSIASPEAARELVIGVSDTGPGVSEELRERIFYPFFTTKDSGSGVGLALAQKLVASHGGDLELDSRPGHGATFRLCLPLMEPGA